MHESAALTAYILSWICFSVAAIWTLFRHGDSMYIGQRAYWQFLMVPWRLASFVAAAALITLIAPYMGDPTWDLVDGFFMSALCYASAPWVVGVLFLATRRRCSKRELWVALVVWLFSASWSYDGYLLVRDGSYPNTWLPNLSASSVIYLSAGMFWNLEWQPDRGVLFAFMRAGWPTRYDGPGQWRIALYAGIFTLPVIAAILVFLI